MKLVDDWDQVLKKAWSVRYMAVAALFSGIEVALPYLVDDFPHGVFAALSAIFTGAAFIARIVAQKEMGVGDN